MCNIIYDKEVFSYSGSNPHDWGYYYKRCPSCLYNPRLKEDIKGLIKRNISATVSASGKIVFNHKELTDLVIHEVIRKWLKLERGEK